MLTNEQKDHVVALATDAASIFNLSCPSIDFDKLKGAAAGRCDGHVVLINSALAEQNWDNFNNTVVHEVAHYVDYCLHNGWRVRGNRRTFHDATFYSYMQTMITALVGKWGDLGAAERCHNYDVSSVARRQRRWEYLCSNGCQHKVSTILHNRIQKGQNRICKCGGGINKENFTGQQLS